MPPVKDPTTGKFVPAQSGADDPNLKPGGEGAPPDKQPDVKATKPSEPLAELSRRFLGDDAKPKKKEDAKPAEKLDKNVPAKKPAAVRKTTTEEILERTASTLDEVVKRLPIGETKKKEDDKKDADPLAGLEPSERRKVNVLKQMEKDFGDTYKGISDKYLAGQKKLSEYFTQWQKDHPGQEFDEDAEEHKEFFNANNVDWNDEDYVESLTNMKADAVSKAAIEEHTKKLNSELSEVKRDQALRNAASNISAEEVTAARSFWGQFGEEFKDLVSPNGTVDAAKLAELQGGKKSTKLNIGIQAAQRVEGLTADMYKLLNGLVAFNDKNPIHNHLVNFALEKEKEFTALPAEERKDKQGRDFKTRKEFRTLSEGDKEKFWTFNSTDFGYMLALEEAGRAKASVTQKEKEFREMAKERGINIEDEDETSSNDGGAASRKVENNPDMDDTENLDKDDGKPRSPSSAAEPKVAATAKKSQGKPSDALNSFFSKQLAKS